MRAIETRTARSKLPVSKNPVFTRLGQGISIGYRKTAGGAGVWVARIADGKGGRSEDRIALADDIAPGDGRTILDYHQAADAVRRLSRGETAESEARSIVTLQDAIDDYKADLEARGGGATNVPRLRHNVTPAMLKRPIGLLDVTELRRWRDGMAKRMVPASVNRVASIMKAVLNLAAAKDERLSPRPWQIALSALPDAGVARNVVLPAETIRKLVQAARNDSPEVGLLIEVLAATGARYSQVARCECSDLIGERLMIPSSAKGRKKRAVRTPVPIGPDLVAALRVAAEGRPASAPLLLRPDGNAWSKSDHARPMKRIVEAAGEDTDIVTAYAMRHSHITGQLLAGLPVQLVAKLHDTSAAMIEKHYAAAIAGQADELVRAAMIDLSSLAGDNVVQLRGERA